jgi:ABC-type maltose transport system permease subunit
MPALFDRHYSLGTLLYGVLIAIIIGLIALYVLFQARHIIDGPMIMVSDVAYDGTSPTIMLSGTTESIVSLSLNGRSIYTDDDGAWSETVVLPVGYTVITLTAEDRYGRVRHVTREYVRRDN